VSCLVARHEFEGFSATKRGGATDAQRREQTVGSYESAIERLRETCIPESRQDTLAGACEEVQDVLLDDDQTVATDDVLVVTAVAAEAIDDVREAKTVGTEADLPVDRQYNVGVLTDGDGRRPSSSCGSSPPSRRRGHCL